MVPVTKTNKITPNEKISFAMPLYGCFINNSGAIYPVVPQNDVIFDLISLPSLYGAAKNVISRRFGIDAGVPRSPFLPVENDEKISAIVEKIEKYVTQLNELGE